MAWGWTLFRTPNSVSRRSQRYLEQVGLKILRRGYSAMGIDIDFVAQHGRTVAFVLVRVRGSEDQLALAGDDSEPRAEMIWPVLDAWIKEYPEHAAYSVRFDVLRFDWYGRGARQPVLRYFPGAIPTPTTSKSDQMLLFRERTDESNRGIESLLGPLTPECQ